MLEVTASTQNKGSLFKPEILELKGTLSKGLLKASPPRRLADTEEEEEKYLHLYDHECLKLCMNSGERFKNRDVSLFLLSFVCVFVLVVVFWTDRVEN